MGTGTPIIESPYGDNVQPEEAPESISRAVASLPPEQMFELMKQMKVRWFQSLSSHPLLIVRHTFSSSINIKTKQLALLFISWILVPIYI